MTMVAPAAAAAALTKESQSLPISNSTIMDIRAWLRKTHHGKELAVLDKFLLELRRNSHFRVGAGAGGGATGTGTSTSDRLLIIIKTVKLMQHIIGATKWKHAAQLLSILRGLGRALSEAAGRSEPAVRNIVRRIMAAVREEATQEMVEAEAAAVDAAESEVQNSDSHNNKRGSSADKPNNSASNSNSSGRLSLQSLLWALPQHVRPSRSGSHVSAGGGGGGVSHLQPQESTIDLEDDGDAQYPFGYYQYRPDLKQAVMEAIQEIMTDLEDVYRNMNEQAVHHVHAGEIILTTGRSRTVEQFLKSAISKKQQGGINSTPAGSFHVLVCRGNPTVSANTNESGIAAAGASSSDVDMDGAVAMAESLAAAGIPTTLIPDAAIFAVMARVHKVLLPAHAVLANGGLIATSGCGLMALAAHYHTVPVVCVTGLFKLCPQFPHEGQDTLNDLLSPAAATPLDAATDPALRDVEWVVPVHDYIPPEFINLYVTNVGSFQPSFIYRLLAEYYHADDWDSF